jgi:hypothetical protein
MSLKLAGYFPGHLRTTCRGWRHRIGHGDEAARRAGLFLLDDVVKYELYSPRMREAVDITLTEQLIRGALQGCRSNQLWNLLMLQIWWEEYVR